MNKKIFFFDFDDTLRIAETDEITHLTYNSLNKLKQQGHLIFLNTGRSYNSLGPQVYTIPFDGFICGCGTFIKYKNKILLEAKLESAQIQHVLSALNTNHIEAIFEGHRGLYKNEIQSSYMINQVVSIEDRGIAFQNTTAPDFHFVKMSLHYPNKEIESNFEIQMSSLFDFIKHSKDETEAVLKGYSKGNALLTVLQKLEIPIENSYAFGDSNNDEEMLLSAGNSVLIGNKAKHLIDRVNFVSKDAKHDGVTFALKSLHLI